MINGLQTDTSYNKFVGFFYVPNEGVEKLNESEILKIINAKKLENSKFGSSISSDEIKEILNELKQYGVSSVLKIDNNDQQDFICLGYLKIPITFASDVRNGKQEISLN